MAVNRLYHIPAVEDRTGTVGALKKIVFVIRVNVPFRNLYAI